MGLALSARQPYHSCGPQRSATERRACFEGLPDWRLTPPAAPHPPAPSQGERSAQIGICRQQQAIPATRIGILRRQEAIPAARNGILRRQEAIPAAWNGILRRQEAIPAARIGICRQQEAIPAARNDICRQQEAIPAARNGILRRQKAIPAAWNGRFKLQQAIPAAGDAILRGKIRIHPRDLARSRRQRPPRPGEDAIFWGPGSGKARWGALRMVVQPLS